MTDEYHATLLNKAAACFTLHHFDYQVFGSERGGERESLVIFQPGHDARRLEMQRLGRLLAVVSSDMGSALYAFTFEVTLAGIAGLSLEAFARTMVAAPVFRDAQTWDHDDGTDWEHEVVKPIAAVHLVAIQMFTSQMEKT